MTTGRSPDRHRVITTVAFPGGLKPDPRKPTSPLPIRAPARPERLLVPLAGPNTPCAHPCVAIGEPVASGQRIAVALAAGSLPVHAPLAGTVIAIETREVGDGTGRELPCVVIATDDRPSSMRLPAWPDWRTRDRAALATRLLEAGIDGLPPAIVQADRPLPAAAAARTLVVNAIDSEPWLESTRALLHADIGKLLEGIALLARVLAAQQVLLALDDDSASVLARLREAIAALPTDPAIDLVTLPRRYPQGNARLLIRTLAGSRDPGSFDCLDVETALAARDAIVDGTPLTRRAITVAGTGIASPCVLWAVIGTPAGDLLAAAGGRDPGHGRIVLGGPFTGTVIDDEQVPIGRATPSVLVLDEPDIVDDRQPVDTSRLRCGRSAEVCPSGLDPAALFEHVATGEWQAAADAGLDDCIECGLCAHVCPSRVPLLAWLRHGRSELAWQRRERERARQSRQRHQARQARLQLAADARAARLKAREQTAPGNNAAQPGLPPAVAAALARARQRTPGGSDP